MNKLKEKAMVLKNKNKRTHTPEVSMQKKKIILYEENKENMNESLIRKKMNSKVKMVKRDRNNISLKTNRSVDNSISSNITLANSTVVTTNMKINESGIKGKNVKGKLYRKVSGGPTQKRFLDLSGMRNDNNETTSTNSRISRSPLKTFDKKINFEEMSREDVIRMKIQRYKEIFNCLDSDKDGLISVRKICLALVDQRILEGLTPLLEELQKTKIVMNFKDFCIRVDKQMSLKTIFNQ